jgi:hypothetical protein
MRSMRRPKRLRHLPLATAAVLGLGLAACGGESPPTADYSIEPQPTAMSLGGSTQFTITDTTPVLWGLEESGTTEVEGAPVFPLKVSENGRYLVDQRDQPWRVQADAAWLMSSKATPEEVDAYLDTRRSQGFNSFYLMAMVHPGGYGAAPDAPNDQRGDPPFATPGDFSTAGASPESARYWEWIDSIVEKAAARDMVVMLSYTYLGWSGADMGWYQDILAQPSEQALHDWGEWLGHRYKDEPNIIWLGLGDFAPEPGSEGSRRTVAIAEGIKAAGAQQLFMAEAAPPDTIPGEDADFGAVVDMNSFYGYGPEGIGTVYETADRAWRFSPTLPAWMQEGTYEYEDNWSHFSGEPWDTRRGRFWSVLAGATAGEGFGSRDVWQWNDIPGSLESPGAEYSTYAFRLFATLPWWDLRPSGTEAGYAGVDLVTSGGGTWGQLDYITSAISGDGRWLLAYVPVSEQGARTFAVEMGSLAGPVRARWFDPSTGNFIAIGDEQGYANEGQREFTTPGSRDDGTDDWLLVLDATGGETCGSIDTTGRYTAPASVPAGLTCQVTAALRSDPAVIARAPLRFADGT